MGSGMWGSQTQRLRTLLRWWAWVLHLHLRLLAGAAWLMEPPPPPQNQKGGRGRVRPRQTSRSGLHSLDNTPCCAMLRCMARAWQLPRPGRL